MFLFEWGMSTWCPCKFWGICSSAWTPERVFEIGDVSGILLNCLNKIGLRNRELSVMLCAWRRCFFNYRPGLASSNPSILGFPTIFFVFQIHNLADFIWFWGCGPPPSSSVQVKLYRYPRLISSDFAEAEHGRTVGEADVRAAQGGGKVQGVFVGSEVSWGRDIHTLWGSLLIAPPEKETMPKTLFKRYDWISRACHHPHGKQFFLVAHPQKLSAATRSHGGMEDDFPFQLGDD